jgi:hypothetical protein
VDLSDVADFYLFKSIFQRMNLQNRKLQMCAEKSLASARQKTALISQSRGEQPGYLYENQCYIKASFLPSC